MDRHDAVVGAHGEKAVPTGIATISGKMQQAPQPYKRAFGHVLARDALEIEIAAQVAVGIPLIVQRSGPGEKPQFAAPAAPGPEAGQADQIVAQIMALGAPAVVAIAPWTNQGVTVREKLNFGQEHTRKITTEASLSAPPLQKARPARRRARGRSRIHVRQGKRVE